MREHTMTSPSPLHGIRVLDLSRLLPGPFATLILRELGADVLKVEDLQEGDYLRALPPTREGLGGAFYALNRGKRSIGIDLKKPTGRDLLLRLVASHDVLVESFRPGVLDRLGLDVETLRAANNTLVICRLSGYGQTGPLRQRAGHDIDFQALAGTLGLTGEGDGAPPLPGAQVADIGGALWATIGILAALRRGVFSDIDISMTESAMTFLLPWLGDQAFGAPPQKRGEGMLNGGLAAYRSYRCADKGHIAAAALEPKFWEALREELNLPVHPKDYTPAREHQDALHRELADTFAQASRDTWAERLAAVDTCVEPVLAPDELPTHPQHVARDVFFTFDDPLRGPSTQLRLPFGEPTEELTPAPKHGEHTDTVLKETGLSDAEIDALRRAHAILP